MPVSNLFPSSPTQVQAVARVRAHINEGTLPGISVNLPDQDTITDLLNEGLEEVATRLPSIRAFAAYPILANVPQIVLGADVAEVIQAAYSTSPSPSTTSAIVYPMQQEEVGRFFDLSGDQPTSGGGIPTYWYIFSDAVQQLTMGVWPPPFQNGNIFIYYVQRPMLWESAVPNSQTQMDSVWARLAILYASAKACESLESNVKADRFEAQYDKLLEAYMERLQRRIRPKSGQTRDVRMAPTDPRPAWMR